MEQMGDNLEAMQKCQNNVFDMVVALLFVAAGVGMVYNECKKKKCRHLDEVNRHKIP